MGENTPDLKKFYSGFAADKGERYLSEIRRFGLYYDEMVEAFSDIVTMSHPGEVLSIGPGVGNVEEVILGKSQSSKVTGIDLSPEMVSVANQRLSQFGERAKIQSGNILNFESDLKFDSVISNLAIHNLKPEEKTALLTKIRDWLKPEGAFVWGDFMDWEDPAVSKLFMDHRKEHVLASGASQAVVDEVFAKEATDPRLTVVQTIDLLRQTGFKPEVIWVKSFLAVFRAKVDSKQ